jgi:arabinose-5-phosphate isomerase
MSMDATTAGRLSSFEQLRLARDIIQTEADALGQLSTRLDTEFCRAVDLLHACQGSVITSGMGKAGLIAQKIAATLASTGTRSHWLHPSEAIHGDLGRIGHDDVVLMLSQSGETEEVLRLLAPLAKHDVPIIAITGRLASTLAHAATVVIDLGPLEEAGDLGLAPSTSTTAMLAMGDALALVTSRMHNFRAEDFARFHPGGSLGHKLKKVEEQMRPLAECRIADENKTVREVIAQPSPGRRSGATMLFDDQGRLSGFFTDSDFRRLFESRQEDSLDGPMRDVMTTGPVCVREGSLLVDAETVMAQRQISELPVLDTTGRPIGLIDITDLRRLETTPAVAPSKSAGPPRPKYLNTREPTRTVDS